MAARYGFGGKASVDEDDMKGRYVFGGGYKGKGRNNLRDTIDKFGKVKDFLNHDDTEMVVPTNLSRPGPNMATRPSWPKLTNFGQMMMVTKKEDDEEKGYQESFTPADEAAEDSSKKRPNNNFCLQDQDDVDSIVPNINLGSNPYPNNNVIKPTNYRGTAMDPPKDDKLSYGVNNTSSNKDNSNKVKESSGNCYTMGQDPPSSVDIGPKQHSNYVSGDRGQSPPCTVGFGPKQHSDYVFDGRGQGPPCIANFGPKQHSDYVFDDRGQSLPCSVDHGPKQHFDYVSNGKGQSPPYTVDLGPKQHSDYVSDHRGQSPPCTVNFGPKQHSDYVSDGIGQIKKQNMHRTNGFPNINWQDQDDESKKNNIRPTPRTLVSNKPKISNGWQDSYYYDAPAPLQPQGRYNYNNRAQRWKEITPNPPPQLRYGGAYPNLRPVYRRPVIDSKWAEKKYNGVLLTDN